MELNDLFQKAQIDPASVLVMRHRPHEPELRRVLPWLAVEKPDYFAAYQQTQGPRAESSMKKAKYLASFIGHEPGKALFVCLYRIGEHKPLTHKGYWAVPAYKELKKLGMVGFKKGDRKHLLWFDLDVNIFHQEWKGRLIVNWPGLERSWYRWADRNHFPIHAIPEESTLVKCMPDWQEIVLTWEELAVLPVSWKDALREWRGIYFIHDQSDGKGYVGSAYGAENIYGRWMNYAKSGHGGNKQLRKRNPSNFKFSIVQRVSPDLPSDEVIQLESSWKERLHTKESGLNDN